MGASPDGLVIDPTEQQPHGLVEIKCPARAEKLSYLISARRKNTNLCFAYSTLMKSMS